MKVDIFKNKGKKGYVIQINETEALQIIKSLSAQIIEGNPNVGREEFYTDNKEYFSISVLCEKEQQYKKLIRQRDEIIEDTNKELMKLLEEKTKG